MAGDTEVKDIAGELPLRFGLDGASCVATGAAAWAAGKRMLEALEAPMEGQKSDRKSCRILDELADQND